MTDFSNINELLAWASTPAGLAVVSAAISIYLRDTNWFENLAGRQKSLYMLLLNLVFLPFVLVYLPQNLSEKVIASLAPIFDMLKVGAMAYMANQATHEGWNKYVLKNREKDATIKRAAEDYENFVGAAMNGPASSGELVPNIG